jgi:microcystin-dependent protein
VFDFGIPAGSAATVTISSTTTLAPGSPATVSNVGTSSAAVLEFGIPQGAAGVGVPTGSILPFGGTSLPSSDWLWCDGSQVSQTTYSTLYAVLGANRYGTDTGGNFFLPDLRERFPRGVSSVTANVTTNNTNTHTHTLNSFSASSTFTGVSANTVAAGAHNHSVNGGSTSNEAGHNHGVNGANVNQNNQNANRATGNAGVALSSHNHTTGGANTNNPNAHSHNTNATNTSSDGGNHSHGYTPSGNVSTTITAGTAQNASHVPAYVEVNYIIKT